MRKSIKNNYFLWIAGGIVLIALVGAAGWFINSSFMTEPAVRDIPVVKTQIISTNENDQSYCYSGEVRGRYESQLAFQVSGKISSRNVDLGSVVKPGDPLVRIDPIDYQQGVAAAKAQLSAAQSQYKLAKDNLERFQEIYNRNLMSQAEFDQYRNAYDSAAAALRQAKAQYTQGSNQLDYCTLRADSAGVVAGVYAETGQVVAAGQPVVVLVKGSEREIEINIPENRLADFNKIKEFQVTFWALPDLTLTGKVREVAPMADAVTRTYKVRIGLVNPPAVLKIGMTATVTATADSGQAAIYIPLTAIYQPGNTPSVWLVRQGTVKLLPVKLGAFGDGDQVQVLEGLRARDVIVTAGVHKLREGEKVRTEKELTSGERI